MRISGVNLYRYRLPLASPLELGSTRLDMRGGLLIRLQSDEGAVGWGEAAPLPEFSGETLDEILDRAPSLARKWVGTSIPGTSENGKSVLAALPVEPDALGALRFGFESAVVGLIASSQDVSLPTVLGGSRSTVQVNALITDLLATSEAESRQIREVGYRAVKVKVGRGPIADEARSVRVLADILGNSVSLRLDANRAWSLEEALRFAEAVRGVEFGYLEEPVADPGALTELMARTNVPIALDETTRETDSSILSDQPGVAAVVLKPTLLGGLSETLGWMDAARSGEATAVISASYESGIGLRMLVALAALGPDAPAGLSTYGRLRADVLSPRLNLDSPSVDVTSATQPSVQVDWSRLEHVHAHSE